jgi:parallel beta-helix repeat protein
MSRFRVGFAVVAMTMSAVAVPIATTVGGDVANAAPSDINVVCTAGTLSSGTFTLTGPCTTTIPLTVPSTITTINGGGNTITAKDTTPGSFNGAVLSNTAAGQSMTIENLAIKGEFTFGTCARTTLDGILFNDAGGSLSNVTVTGITENSSCQVGNAIVAAATSARTVTMTNIKVSDYNKNGVRASGPMTMDVSASTIGPPAALAAGVIAQNGLEYITGATGTTTGSTIDGSGFGEASTFSTAVLLFGGKNVTLSGNTITGSRTDVGIEVTSDSTGNTISHNQINRTAADSPDNFGLGVDVDQGPPASSATLICNTFSGWKTNLSNVTQALCVITTSLPGGTACHAYPSTTLVATGGTTPYKWSLASGSLPTGLTLSSSGVISGTPTKAGTFSFSVKVTDSSSTPETATQALTITVAADCTTTTTTPTTPAAATAPITNTTVPVTG